MKLIGVMSLHVNQTPIICATKPPNALMVKVLHVKITIVRHSLTPIASIVNATLTVL